MHCILCPRCIVRCNKKRVPNNGNLNCHGKWFLILCENYKFFKIFCLIYSLFLYFFKHSVLKYYKCIITITNKKLYFTSITSIMIHYMSILFIHRYDTIRLNLTPQSYIHTHTNTHASLRHRRLELSKYVWFTITNTIYVHSFFFTSKQHITEWNKKKRNKSNVSILFIWVEYAFLLM